MRVGNGKFFVAPSGHQSGEPRVVLCVSQEAGHEDDEHGRRRVVTNEESMIIAKMRRRDLTRWQSVLN